MLKRHSATFLAVVFSLASSMINGNEHAISLGWTTEALEVVVGLWHSVIVAKVMTFFAASSKASSTIVKVSAQSSGLYIICKETGWRR